MSGFVLKYLRVKTVKFNVTTGQRAIHRGVDGFPVFFFRQWSIGVQTVQRPMDIVAW